MVYRPSIDDKLCFVLMPFGHPFDSYYEKILKPAAEGAHLHVLRADAIYSTGSIITDIWKKIWAARVVIADVTGKNANVNYELGLCHALGVPTILITKEIGDVPFDYRHRRCIVYNVQDADWAKKLSESLQKTIEAVLTYNENDDELIWPYETSRAIPLLGGGSLISSENPRNIVIQGVHLVGERMGKAFGPAGRHFSVSIGNREPMSFKHGYTIAEGMRSANPLESAGIRHMQQVAEEIYKLVGDGTKTGIILASTLIAQANERLRRGFGAGHLLKGIVRGIDDASRQLHDWAKPVHGDQVLHVATTAAMDAEAGQFVEKAMQSVGKDGVITVEESSNTETVMEIVEGMELDRGYLSEHFVTGPEHNEVFLENPFILVYDRKISSMRDLLPLLEQAAKSNESFFIIAEDVEREALATLVMSKMRGFLKVAAIKAPGFADTRKAMLEDIATLTGTKVISDLGFTLETITLTDLGRAKSVTVQKDRTMIVEGAGNPNDIQGKIRTIRTQIEESMSSYDRENLQYRLAKLFGGIAVIKVGGVSLLEIVDKKYRMVSAVHSARAAVESGVLPGGAISLYRSAQLLKQIPSTDASEAEGLACVAAALEEPIRNLIHNAQGSPTQILEAISEASPTLLGFNVENKRIEDLEAAGILDPTNTLTIGLRVAYAHAKTILETEDWDLNSTPSQPPSLTG